MLLFVLFLAAALAVLFLTDLHKLISASSLRRDVARCGPWAYAIYIAAYALLITLGFPGSVLTVSGAIVFGTWLNTGLTIIGATAGACGAFLVARFLARDWVAARLDGRARRIDRWIARRGVMAVFMLRLLPIVPFNVINFASGLTAISFPDYTWTTAVGMAPGVFAYSYITNQAIEVDLRHPETLLEPGLLAAFALIVFLSVIVPVAWHFYERRRGNNETY